MGPRPSAGNYVWLFGGHDASGPVGAVQRGTLGLEAAEGLPENPDEGKLVQWGISDAANLPAARDDPAAWAVNGILYVAGGDDGTGPQRELYWAPPTADGAIAEWKHLDVSDLPYRRRAARRRQRAGCDHRRRADPGWRRRLQPAREHRATGAVLPPRPGSA